MASRTTKIPAIRKSHNVPKEVSVILSAIKQTLEVREGLRGDPLDRFISVRELRELMDTDHETVLTITTATDHGGLIGLADDDHTQYYNSARIAVWSGSPNITTLGTIGTGTWQGTPIANAYVAGLDQDLLQSSSPTFAGLTINGSITVTGNVDGRDVSADGTKLDGIEDNADVTPQLPSDENLAGYWSFDEGSGSIVKDSSVNENDGAQHNSPAWVAGKSGFALDFDGADNTGAYIALGVCSELNLDEITISAWVNLDTLKYNSIVRNGQTTDEHYQFFVDSAGKVVLGWYDGSFKSVGTTNNVITTGSWFHIVAVRDSSNYTKIYVNSELEGEGQATQQTGGGGIVTIGGYIYTQNTDGLIDEVRIYNRALSESEIKALYLNPGGQKTAIGATVLQSDGSVSLTDDWNVDGSDTLFIDKTNGRIGVGTDSPEQNLTVATNTADTGLQINTFSITQSQSAHLYMAHSLTNTIGAHTAVTVNDGLGTIHFLGSNGTGFVEGARIDAIAGQNYTDVTNSGRLRFWTTSAGETGPTERMRITQDGDVGIGTNSPSEKLHVAGAIYDVGKTVEVTNKNKSQVYLVDSTGNILLYQNYYWNGSSWVATSNYGFGHGALANNTGASSNGFGRNALQNNTEDYCNGFGYGALQNNAGFGSCGFGHVSLQNNTEASCSGFGYYTLRNNNGSYSSGFGYYTLRNNNGEYSDGFGSKALENNNGDYSAGFGFSTLRYNQSSYNIAIGYQAWASFLEDTSGNKTFDYTDIDTGTDRITVTAHGFGSTGDYVNVKYTEGTSPITGLTDGNIYQVKIIDANTIGFNEKAGGTNITAAGTGTGHTLTPQHSYTNSIVIGHDVDPSASNQVTLGNDSITETLLKGDVRVESGELTLKETTTPTADSGYGKVYTKSDNKLYFQDGAGTEHEIAFV